MVGGRGNRKVPTIQRISHNAKVILRKYGPFVWLATVLGFATVFALGHRAEMERIRILVLSADRGWLAALVALEIVILGLVAATYRSLLSRLGHHLRLIPLMGVHLQRVVVGTVTPVGGPSSMIVFVHALRNRGVRPSDALLAVSIKSVIGNAAFLVLLIPVVFLQEPSVLLLAATGGLLGIVAVTSGLLALALRRSKPPAFLIRRLPRKGLRFLAQVRQHDLQLTTLVKPFLLMMTTKLAGALMLFIALHAVDSDPGIQVALTAYLVGMVVLLVAPIFQGIGFVEVGMALALQQHGVPPVAAVGATLLCRVGDLWLPLAAGIIMQTVGTVSERVNHARVAATAVPGARSDSPASAAKIHSAAAQSRWTNVRYLGAIWNRQGL